MPVAVRNLSSTKVVLSRFDAAAIEWEHAGHPDGTDVQQVPQDLLEETAFLRAIAKGILSVEESDEGIKAMVAAQAERYRQEQAAEKDAIAGLLDRQDGQREIVLTESALQQYIDSRGGTPLSQLTADAQ